MDSLGQFFEGEIIAIRPTGTLDIKTSQGAIFQNTPQLNVNGQREFQLGEAVVVLVAAGKNYCLGTVAKPENQLDGSVSTRRKEGVFPNDTKATRLKSRNIDGTTAEVSVSPATGILLDSGKSSIVHIDPGQETIMTSSKRIETYTPRSAARVGDGEANWLIRSEPDLEQLSKELAREDLGAPNGSGVFISAFENEDSLSVVVTKDGQPNIQIEIKSTGELNISSPSFGVVTIDADGISAASQKDIKMTAAQDGLFEGNRIKLGSESASEPYVIVSKLEAVISSLVQRFAVHQHNFIVPLIPGAASPTLPDPLTNPPTLGTPLTWQLRSNKITGE